MVKLNKNMDMSNYKEIENICRRNKQLSHEVIDEFLIHYAAQRDNLEREIRKHLSRYRHVISEMPEDWDEMIKTQYVCHRIFKHNGLINKYLNHSAIKNLSTYKREFLQQQAQYPWRFSFSIITHNPAQHFFEMEDVFRHEKFLLYSESITNLLEEEGYTLWFNLIGYNGACWQSYGPVNGYKSFEPDDIFFFATELHPDKFFEYDEDIAEDVENNPVPYMMLLAGANYPCAVNRNEQIVEIMAQYDTDRFDSRKLEQDFTIESSRDVYGLVLNGWDHPHFATAYYDEKEQLLTLYAMTDRGFEALVDTLNKYGYHLSREPEVRINPSMRTTAEEILKKQIQLHPYEDLFAEEDVPPEEQEETDKINYMMELALPEINAGKQPDIDALAREADLDVETAREIMKTVMDKFNDMESRM